MLSPLWQSFIIKLYPDCVSETFWSNLIQWKSCGWICVVCTNTSKQGIKRRVAEPDDWQFGLLLRCCLPSPKHAGISSDSAFLNFEKRTCKSLPFCTFIHLFQARVYMLFQTHACPSLLYFYIFFVVAFFFSCNWSKARYGYWKIDKALVMLQWFSTRSIL